MKRFGWMVLAASLVGVPSLMVQNASAEDAACGEKGQPSCPLQGWMEKQLQDPLDKNDLAALSKALEKLSSMAPDAKWNDGATGWSKLAKDGAAAAKAGDAAATNATCKSCHKAWRSKYKKEFRTKPISG